MKRATKITRLFILGFLALTVSTYADSSGAAVPPVGSLGNCISISQNLYVGIRDTQTGGQVTALQTFLKNQGYLTHAPTGFFGSLTEAAVRAFQVDHDVSPTGYVGPQTRKSFTCVSTLIPVTPSASSLQISSITPNSGPIGSTVTIVGTGFTATDNTIHFGSGGIMNVSSANGTTLQFTVPSALGPICAAGSSCPLYVTKVDQPGMYAVSVENSNGTSNASMFTVTAAAGGVVDCLTANCTLISPMVSTPSAALSTSLSSGGAGTLTPTQTGIVPTALSPVIVSSITPNSGPIGTMVTLSGSGFTTATPNNIYFGSGEIVGVTALNSTTLQFAVPSQLDTPCPEINLDCTLPLTSVQPGTYTIYVQNLNGSSNGLAKQTVSFTVTGSIKPVIPPVLATTIVVTSNNDGTPTNTFSSPGGAQQHGIFTMTIPFTVTALQGTAYIPSATNLVTAGTVAVPTATVGPYIQYAVDNGTSLFSGATANITYAGSSGLTPDANSNYQIPVGQPEQFHINISYIPSVSGQYRATLVNIPWSINDSTTYNPYVAGLDSIQFETPYVSGI